VTRTLRVATRASALARWQAEHVAALVRSAEPSVQVELVPVETTGDARLDVPLHTMGGQGVFVKEVQQAVLEGRADCAVHSAKDLPSSFGPEGLVIAAVPERADPRDVLVGRALDDLDEGATVATGSVRRRAQLRALRPDLTFAELRGNIQTRLAKVPAGGALVMAAAALERLGLQDHVAEVLPVERMVPQVGQGALAVECRRDDTAVRALLRSVDHVPARVAVETERAFLAVFGAGCDLPIGAHAPAVPGRLLTFAWFDGPRGTYVHRKGQTLGERPMSSARQAAEAALDAARRKAGYGRA
jgi:hydroxymethylbilane synthase